MRVTPRWRRALAIAAATLALLGPELVHAPAAAAETGGGGASSRVVGRGDIVTSIIGWHRGRSAPGRPTPVPVCRWLTLHDAQIEWLAAVSASSAGMGGPNPVLESVRELLAGEELPDGDLQARVCGSETEQVRFVPRAEPLDGVELLQRRMITRLPVPEPSFSPPAQVPVPLHQPVFASIDPSRWRPIAATITSGDVTAEVRAEPVGLRVISGDPTGEVMPCEGPARPFDATSARSVRRQADDPRTCAFSYRLASPIDPASGQPASWVGTVTALWHAEWRTDDGPWRSLGTIPRTRLFDRTARELHSSIEAARR